MRFIVSMPGKKGKTPTFNNHYLT